ncbi:helix-turn-helix domain-containing protein [Isoptericola sp. NEAU-Y5]|uniref:Helix-turn-helix domain-containing protein n=1 Tax=Isoptericola luteus TaxID=2879484 RepID=A0ABS7ZIS9_9MICO|nr:helix-turn-helix domain-containing protein [Isoptericola sp. NEAU-Y5]MCA5894933.1 helix-turn-helix domain-containing protein [Isoptericola sp. NEAU-Y5]
MFEHEARRQPTASTHGIVDPAAAATGFELVRLEPAPDLADLVERHWVIRWDLPPGAEFRQVVIPHPNANAVAEAGGWRVHGVPAGLFSRTLHGHGAVVGTKLRPGALRMLLGDPEAVRPDLVMPAGVAFAARAPGYPASGDVEAAGRAAVLAALSGDVAGAVEPLTPVLRAVAARRRTARSTAALDRVARALAAVVGGELGPDAGVRELAAHAGTTPRSLQRLFAHWVGVSPKWVLQRHRVHLAADLLAVDPGRSLADLATAVGYYDQAHLSADFARALGVPPAAFARRCAEGRRASPTGVPTPVGRA